MAWGWPARRVRRATLAVAGKLLVLAWMAEASASMAWLYRCWRTMESCTHVGVAGGVVVVEVVVMVVGGWEGVWVWVGGWGGGPGCMAGEHHVLGRPPQRWPMPPLQGVA